MRFTTQAKHKFSRRFGVNIFGHKKNPIEKRNTRPGQHGMRRRDKMSNYGLQLDARQLCRIFFGCLRENQFRNIYKKASRMKGSVGINFLSLLERRLCSVVFRSGMAQSIFHARQMISHGHICVNGSVVDIASYVLSVGDKVSVLDRMRDHKTIKKPLVELPSHIKNSDDPYTIVLESTPDPESSYYPFEIQRIVEWYSRRT